MPPWDKVADVVIVGFGYAGRLVTRHASLESPWDS